MSVKQTGVVMLMCAALLFTGCGNSREQYVDLESIETNANIDAPEEISGYDDTCYADYTVYSYNSGHIYGGMIDTVQEVDILKQTYKYLCARVGCNHRYDDACELNQDRSGIRYYNGGLLYTNEDSLYYRSTYGKIKKLHTNTYSTDFSQKNYPVTKEEPNRPKYIDKLIFLNENELLICAYNYVYAYDLQNEKAGEPIEICDSLVMGVCVNGEEIYSYNMNGEAFLTNLEDKSTRRILEQGTGIKLLNGRLWYAVWEDGAAQIRSSNTDLTDERVEAEADYAEFVPCDEGVLYSKKNGGNDIVMLHTFDGDEKELLNTGELTYANGKYGYEYGNNGVSSPIYIGGKLYINCIWFGAGENFGENDEAIVWYCVDNGKITELTGE